MVRMEWSLDEFFSNGGTASFADRVSGSLGIHASDIKIVSVFEGSLTVNYDVLAEDPAALSKLQKAQTALFATGGMDLGAPILDVAVTVSSSTGTAAAAEESLIQDGMVSADGYEAIVITKTAANSVTKER